MNSRYFLLYILALFFVVPFAARAQSAKPDLVTISKIDFKKLSKNDILRSNGQWIRIEIILSAISDAEKKTSNNAQWIRNVGVQLTLVYEDNKDTNRRNREKVVMQESVKLFALEANKEASVVFYIPPEAYSIYAINKAEPFAWSVDLSVDGTKIPLSKNNYKTMLSRKIWASGGNITKVLESYQKLVESSVKANAGVLMSLPKTPFQVQYYEINRGSSQYALPTYVAE